MTKVVRLDRVAGTHNPALIRSAKFFDAAGKEAAIENGELVVIGEMIDGERELIKVTAVVDDTPATAVVGVVCTPEVEYEQEGYHDLDTFANAAGDEIRVIILQANDVYSVTDDVAKDTAKTVGNVTVTAVAKEVAGKFTYTVYTVA